MLQLDELSDKDFVNFVITLITDHRQLVGAWSKAMFYEEYNVPESLKNDAFTIWFVGSIDTVDQFHQSKMDLFTEAQNRGLAETLHLVRQTQSLVWSLEERLMKFGLQEQIAIKHRRNAIVHGHLYQIHKENIRFRLFDPDTKTIVRIDNNKSNFWEIVRAKWGNNQNHFLSECRVRFFDMTSDYYYNICHLFEPGMFQGITRRAYEEID